MPQNALRVVHNARRGAWTGFIWMSEKESKQTPQRRSLRFKIPDDIILQSFNCRNICA